MMRRSAVRFALPLLALPLMAAGCTMAPRYQRPATTVPASWPVGDAYLRQQEATLPSYSYRDVLADPRLVALVDQALANNQDVQRAAAQIAAARAQYRIQRADLLPQVDVSGTYRRSDPASGPTGESFGVDAGLSSYEIDLFGRVRSLTDAAQGRYFASEAAARAVRLALVADVADAWLDHATDSTLLAIARRTAADARESVRLTQRRLDGGVAPRSDLRQAQIVLRTAEADIAAQTNAVAQDLNALQLLVGAPVDPALLPASIDDAAAKLREVPAGIDSSILLRRPDVIEAEWTLRAANAQIGAARAALFPRISLTSVLGFASTALSALFDNGSFAWDTTAGVSQSLFDGGAARANMALTQAQRDTALAGYRKAVQSAFADVANALARRGTIEPQVAAVASGRDAAADNARLAELRYRGGVTSYLESLSARQSLYSAERNLANVQRARASNLVSLYRALGGDPLVSPPGTLPAPSAAD